MTTSTFEDLLQDTKNSLDHHLLGGSYSIGFVRDLVVERVARRYNVSSIMDEVAILDGRSPLRSVTKPAAQFRGGKLGGYWHKHHTQTPHIARNLADEMGRNRTIEKMLAPLMGQELSSEKIAKLCHELVIGDYNRRRNRRRLTGEWIVFSKIDGKNHYITLASHDDGDDVIAKRIATYLEVDREIALGAEIAFFPPEDISS